MVIHFFQIEISTMSNYVGEDLNQVYFSRT